MRMHFSTNIATRFMWFIWCLKNSTSIQSSSQNTRVIININIISDTKNTSHDKHRAYFKCHIQIFLYIPYTEICGGLVFVSFCYCICLYSVTPGAAVSSRRKKCVWGEARMNFGITVAFWEYSGFLTSSREYHFTKIKVYWLNDMNMLLYVSTRPDNTARQHGC